MKSDVRKLRFSSAYLVSGGIFLLAATIYVVIIEPTTFNLALGFFAFALFGTGTFIGIRSLLNVQRKANDNHSSGLQANKPKLFYKLLLTSFKQSIIILAGVIALVYLKGGNINLNVTSWLIIVFACLTLTSVSAYAKKQI